MHMIAHLCIRIMNDYGMTIIAGGREIEIPVLPQKLKVTSPGNNDKATVLVLGDILILRKKGLRTVAWDSFFPVNDAPFVTGRITDPVEIVRAIQDARDGLDPVRFLITGTDLDIIIVHFRDRDLAFLHHNGVKPRNKASRVFISVKESGQIARVCHYVG